MIIRFTGFDFKDSELAFFTKRVVGATQKAGRARGLTHEYLWVILLFLRRNWEFNKELYLSKWRFVRKWHIENTTTTIERKPIAPHGDQYSLAHRCLQVGLYCCFCSSCRHSVACDGEERKTTYHDDDGDDGGGGRQKDQQGGM